MDEAQRRHILELVRGRCLALPETSERLSHGAPTFFVGKEMFWGHDRMHQVAKAAGVR